MRTEANSKRCRRPLRHPGLTACAAALGACAVALLAGAPVAAQEFRLHVEPAAAFWLDEPQSDRFTPGFYGAIRPGVALGRVVDLQWSYSLLWTPAGEGFDESGTAHFLSTGVRVRPLGMLQPESEQLGGLFADANLGYVRTEDLDRFGFDVGMGYGFQVAPSFSIGPVLRYVQIVQSNDTANQDPSDAQFLTVGLDLAFGEAPAREGGATDEECPAAPECVDEKKGVLVEPPMTVAEAPPACPDGDRDGVCDAEDRCPMKVGPPATLGCPIDPCSGAPLVVLVQFEYDSAAMPPPQPGQTQTMDPVLDSVAQAIAQDPSCRVCIVGHASIEGTDEHNQELSRKRAAAVQSYMSARGLNETRMPTTGLGARCQIVPESSLPLNRRVEFRRLQEGEYCPTDCSP